MRKAALLFVATLAVWMARRALQRQPEVITMLWVIIGLSAASGSPNSPKARSVEHRLATVITGVGQVQNAANNAQGTANNAQTAANNAQNTANNAQNTANNANNAANNANANAHGRVSKNGDTINGNLTINGSLNVTGTISSGFDIHCGNAFYIGGFRIDPSRVTGGSQPDPPATYTASWEAGVSHRVNNLTRALGS